MRASYPLIIHGNIPHRVRHRNGPAPLVTYLVGNRYQRPKACGQLPRSDSAASLARGKLFVDGRKAGYTGCLPVWTGLTGSPARPGNTRTRGTLELVPRACAGLIARRNWRKRLGLQSPRFGHRRDAAESR